MNKTLQWKVLTMLGYVALLMTTLVSEDGMLQAVVRVASPQ